MKKKPFAVVKNIGEECSKILNVIVMAGFVR